MSYPQITLRRTSSNQVVNLVIPQEYEQTHKDLMAYNGTFDLLLNMRSSLIRYGKLSDRQWAAAAKCLAPKPLDQPQILSVKCNRPIIISTNTARQIARINNWPFNPRTLIVTQIKSTDRKGFTVVVKIDWTGDSQDCRCCGKALTDWRSQATGVGPVCVKRTSIKYVTNQADVARFQMEMEALAQKLGEVEVTLKRWNIQAGLQELIAAAIHVPSTTTVVPTTPTQPTTTSAHFRFDIANCTWNPARKTFVVNADKFAIPRTTVLVEVFNKVTGNSKLFVRCTEASVGWPGSTWRCEDMYLINIDYK